MKNIITILFLSLLFNGYSFSQKVDVKSDTAVYHYLLKEINKNKNDINIYYKTSLQILKQVDFKSISLTGLAHWQPKDTVKGMKLFFDHIDINSLTEYELTTKIGSHSFINKMPEGFSSYNTQRIITLSPIIYSADKHLALCSVDEYGEGEMVYLLMFKTGTWKIVNAKYMGGP